MLNAVSLKESLACVKSVGIWAIHPLPRLEVMWSLHTETLLDVTAPPAQLSWEAK